jgi:hypothetical protein
MTVYVVRRKMCTKCGELKPLDQFHKYSRSLDGLKSECKSCRSELSRHFRETSTKTCSIPDCDETHYGRGFCSKHWARFYRHQDALKLTRNAPEVGKGGAAARALFVETYKVEQGCQDCGYVGPPRHLTFDHLPGTVKVRDIKSGQHFGWKALLEEIEKCEVVCWFCHSDRTYERRREVMPMNTQRETLEQNGR